jgi:hypothetical protein
MSRSKFLICLGIILMAAGISTAYIFAWVRLGFPESLKTEGDVTDSILPTLLSMLLLSVLESGRWTDFVIIFLAALLKYSGIILVLVGSYLWIRKRSKTIAHGPPYS